MPGAPRVENATGLPYQRRKSIQLTKIRLKRQKWEKGVRGRNRKGARGGGICFFNISINTTEKILKKGNEPKKGEENERGPHKDACTDHRV